MNSSIPFTLTNKHGDILNGNVHRALEAIASPILIICHGFKGFKDWGSFPYICDFFAKSGITVVRFNFSLNGIGDDPMTFTELEKFGRNTFSRELDDLGELIDSVWEGNIVPENADRKKIALLGHSRGGGIVILKAATDKRIRSVVSWSSVVSFDRWGESLKQEWRERGVLHVTNTRTKQRMPLNVSLLEDVEQNSSSLDILAAAEKIRIPFLIVHGEQDVSVPVAEARQIFMRAKPDYATLTLIPNADHTFGTSQPFTGSTDALESALNKSSLWLHRVLH